MHLKVFLRQIPSLFLAIGPVQNMLSYIPITKTEMKAFTKELKHFFFTWVFYYFSFCLFVVYWQLNESAFILYLYTKYFYLQLQFTMQSVMFYMHIGGTVWWLCDRWMRLTQFTLPLSGWWAVWETHLRWFARHAFLHWSVLLLSSLYTERLFPNISAFHGLAWYMLFFLLMNYRQACVLWLAV